MKKSEKAIATSSKIKFEESGEHESSSENVGNSKLFASQNSQYEELFVHTHTSEGEIERELADVTFEELQKARSNGSHAVYRNPNSEKKGGRANKNRPMEASAKKPVGRFREVIQVPKKVSEAAHDCLYFSKLL
ncbi:hypothetical protein Acr_00g0027460 [Actinidia rufa]|uniref:rRNA biogenesis protein RRP36 n=1 Tax=Actinidia rufa TaxID=165716 RepID=A0A7J0DDZ3_9ERIC|nr:hypothetical protein Acr_00g0027460 [Actinidia rufa]